MHLIRLIVHCLKYPYEIHVKELISIQVYNMLTVK